MAMATVTPPTTPPAIAPILVLLEVPPDAELSPPIAVWSKVILGFGRLGIPILLEDSFRKLLSE
jgi:hypothetical protein